MELVLLVLRAFDVRSYFSFRQVNRKARLIATGIREYKLISKYGLEGLQGLLRTKLAPCFTMGDLYRPLVTDKCLNCGNFGSLLFLLTAERCCFACLLTSVHYRTIAPPTFTELSDMSPSLIDHQPIPKLRTVPGVYNFLDVTVKRPEYLIAEERATQTFLASKILGDDAVRKLRERREVRNERFMAATAYPYYDLTNARVERGVNCKGCQMWVETNHTAVTTANPSRVYSTQGFLDHFSDCREAQEIWTTSERGTRPVNDSEMIRSGGYINTSDEL
ncbi:hypothetical protein NPX13_g10127 [Xylaria arbuscula]|uniref:F-box domain-containing protein n=1 Tax=Xylaria arbuscula TaxID=114810 RepID=A0A9W8TIC9_9PEZI|nr:hypothetical protein NPX13_g10127 [Xylaria arbuscula]